MDLFCRPFRKGSNAHPVALSECLVRSTVSKDSGLSDRVITLPILHDIISAWCLTFVQLPDISVVILAGCGSLCNHAISLVHYNSFFWNLTWDSSLSKVRILLRSRNWPSLLILKSFMSLSKSSSFSRKTSCLWNKRIKEILSQAFHFRGPATWESTHRSITFDRLTYSRVVCCTNFFSVS